MNNWIESIDQMGVAILIGMPSLSFIFLVLPSWLGWPWKEKTITMLSTVTFASMTGAALGLGVFMAIHRLTDLQVSLGTWFEVGHYSFELDFVVDRLSLPYALFSAVLVGIIGSFSRRYLHREEGFLRFYALLFLFAAGVQTVVLAGSIDMAFVGWELVGLSSALLIAFFQNATNPVRHGFRAFVTYRVCDIGLLTAAVWLHHSVGDSKLGPVLTAPWHGFAVPNSIMAATWIGLALLWASIGKSAQVPLGGWLPRAMEGPTPSSAIFYGAISIHLGPYLLLRAAPIIEASPLVAAATISVGAITALHATLVGRVQSDVKSVLAYASMTQVGLIFVEIGLGFRFFALLHIVGHATVRTLQILRSPHVLRAHQEMEQSFGGPLPPTGSYIERWLPRSWQHRLYFYAIERGGLDAIVIDTLIARLLGLLRLIDRIDRAITDRLAGQNSKEPR